MLRIYKNEYAFINNKSIFILFLLFTTCDPGLELLKLDTQKFIVYFSKGFSTYYLPCSLYQYHVRNRAGMIIALKAKEIEASNGKGLDFSHKTI
jgi:hypothetical protein